MKNIQKIVTSVICISLNLIFYIHFLQNVDRILILPTSSQYICKAQTKITLDLVYSSQSRIPRDLISRFYIQAQFSKTTKSNLINIRKWYIFRRNNIFSHGFFFVFYYSILHWFYANGVKVCKGDWRWYLQ